jgi:cellulose synthase/poly-beta-1,6-N-acetylglucosamine synthase-like glycosyltransferase
VESELWLVIGTAALTCVGYPLLASRFLRLRRDKRARPTADPMVTVVLTACRDEATIRQKLAEALDLDYPLQRLEVIVASSCPIDVTHTVVSEYSGRGARLVALEARASSAAAQNAAAAVATGDLVLFAEATTELHRDALRELVRSFREPSSGSAANLELRGRMRFTGMLPSS